MNAFRIVAASLLTAALLMTATTTADAAWGRSGYNPSKVRSNYPGWQNTYPGSSRRYGNLPFYMRADRRPLGLTP